MSSIRRWNRVRIAFWTGLGLLLFYMVVLPGVLWSLSLSEAHSGAQEVPDITLPQLIRIRSTEAFMTTMFVALGACFGSFLNVVVWRAPRGESVLFKPSACPSCQERILGKDNLPVVGWLKLQGRCRNCESPISARYPIVESVIAGLFALFFFVELISGGANLPERWVNAYAGVVWILLYTKWDLVGLYFFHCIMLTTLLCWALIDGDRNRIPWWLLLGPVAATIGAVLWFPHLMPVPVTAPVNDMHVEYIFQHALRATALGSLVGLLLGGVQISMLRRGGERPVAFPRSSMGGHVLIGAALGWQAACGVALITWGLWAVVRFVRMRRPAIPPLPISFCLLTAAILHHALWRVLYDNLEPWWLTAKSPWWQGIVFVLLGLAVLLLGIRVRSSARKPVTMLGDD